MASTRPARADPFWDVPRRLIAPSPNALSAACHPLLLPLLLPLLPQVTTCHSYDIYYKYRYGCKECGKEVGRQSKSIDLDRARCPRCYGKFALLGAFNRDGTPIVHREPTAFAKYVKDHFSTLKGAR